MAGLFLYIQRGELVLANDNIRLHITADVDDKTGKSIKDIKGNLKEIPAEVTTTVKLNHKQADISIEAYKKKLKDITAPIETNTKVRLDTRSALASLNNLNAKLKELKDSDLKLKFSVEGASAIKALSNGIQSFNKSADAANKKLDKLKNISEILGKIEKNVGINVSINGADETSNRLKEIYGLLKGIRKYSNVKINANANVGGGSPRVQAQPQGSNGNGGSSLGSYASQLKGIVAKAEQAHMRGDAQELARLRQEYVLTTQEMLNFQRQFGNGDYNNAIKKLTPIVQTLQRLGIIARDDLGPIRELNNMQFNWDAQMKASTPRTYKQMAQTEKELAEYARQNGNLAESDNHLRNAARLEAEARSVNAALEVQRTLQGQIEQTLKEQIKSLEKIAAEQRMQGDTRNLAYTEARLRQLRQEEQLAKARQNPDTYKGLMQEANVYKEQLANPTLTPEARRQLYTQIINTVSNATRQGLRDGMIDNRQAAKNYQKLMPYARELGVENNLQNEITRLGGTTNNVGGQQANNARNEYNDLKRQAVQAIEDINRAWRAGNGTEAEERRLDNILNRMRQIKREAGTLNQSTEANLYTTLANGTQRGSRGYDILSARARQAREKRDTLRTDTGAGTSKNSFANGLAYAIRFIGRSTKGTGSAMEASAQLLKDVQQIGPEAGIFARALKGAVLPAMALMGVFESLNFGAQLAVQGLQTFGNMLVQIGTTIYNALKPGIELFKTMTASRFSFGASILSNGYDENGNKLSDIFKNNKTGVLGISDELITKAQFDAEKSAFSFEEILRSLQGTLPMLLSKGMSLNEAYDVNKGVAGVAKLIQLTPSQILQETRDLAQGSITARGSQVANALGVTNEDLAGKSADEIFEFLMEKFENFTEFVNRFEDTAYGRAQQLEERLQLVSEKFVENLSAGFQGIFENLIRFTGEWKGTGKDASGKEVNATYDSITQKWTNDETGETLDKLDENGDVIQDWKPDKSWFELTDVMKEIGDSLKDIVEYTINAADAMLTFVEGATGMSDPIEIAKTAIEGVITAFEFCFDVVTTLIGLLFEFEQPIMVAINLTKMLGLALELVVEAVVGVVKNALGAIVNLIATVGQKIRQLYNGVLKHIPDSIKAELGLTPMDENVNVGIMSAIDKMHTNDWEHIKQTFASLTDPNSYYGSYQDMFGKVTNNSHDGVENKHTLWNWYLEGIRKQNEKDKNKKNSPYSMNNVNGNPNPVDKDADKKAKAAQRAADKANREAIKESQRMLKERQQALKEILDDTLNNLKEELRKAGIAYKQGFLTIGEYFTKKAEIERAEAEARLKEAKEERIAIENSRFNNDYEKLAALHKVDREIRKYRLEVGKSVTAQKELNNLLSQYSDIISNSNLTGTFNRINSGNGNISLSKDGNGNISLSKDDNDFKYKADQSVKVLESLAPNGLEWVVDEIVNQAIANGVEPALAVAIAKNESGFDQNAISPVGAIGIGQLMPDTAAGLGVNPYDWKQNILGMIKYIKELWETFGGDIAKVIAAYNAGPAAVKTYGGIPPYPETQAYYENVASTRDSAISSGYDLFDTDLGRLNDINQKLWQSQQENTQAVQSNTQSINGGTQTNNKLLGVWKPKNDRSNETDSKLWDLAFKETEEAHKRGYVVNPGVFRGIHQMEAQENGVLTWLPRNYNNYWGLKYDANNASKYNMYDTGMRGDDGGTYAGFNNIDDGIRAFFDNYIDHKGTSYLGEIANASNDGYAVAQIMYNNGYFTGNPYDYGQAMSEYTDEYNSWGLPAVVDVFSNSLQANTQAVQSNTQAIQGNSQTINGIQVDTRELGNIVASAPDNPDIVNESDATKLFMQAMGNAWKVMHPELPPLEVSSGRRYHNTGSHHYYGEAFDVVNDYFDNPKLREEYVNLANSLGGKGLSEWTKAEQDMWGASGPNMHVTTPNANYGNGGIFSASTPSNNTLNNLPQAQADTSDLAVAARDAINKFIEEYNNVVKDIRSNIFGEMPDFKVEFAETYKKLENLEKVSSRDELSAKMVEKLKIQIRQKIAKLETDFYENMLEVNLERIQQTGKDIANRIATGQADQKQIEEYYKKYWGYFHGDGQDVEVMKKNLKEMEQKKKKALNTWLTSKDGGKEYSNGELIAKYKKEYLDLNNKQYELEQTEGSTQEEINKVIAQKLEKRKKLHEMYAMRDFIFKPIEDSISEYRQEIMLAMQTPINQMIQLEKQYIEQQDMGNVGAAQEIRKRLESAREALYGVFETWIKAIEDKFDIMDNYFAEMPVTNLQREQGERELKAFRNMELAKANQDKLNALTEEYRGRTFRITKNEQEMAHWKDVQAQAERDGVRGNDAYVEAGKHIKELADDTQAAKLEMSELNRQIGDTDNLIRLEKELSKLPDLFRDAGKVAKQALEDGLVTFLTDGVNEAESLEDALLDLAQTFLKTMQEFFAKQMVTTLMNALFGHYDTEGNGERNDLFKRATVSQDLDIKDENAKEHRIVYFSGADNEIVGGDIRYTDENAKATVKALKDAGIIARLDENGKGYSVPVSSDEASKWYTDYVKNTTVERGNQTLEGIKSEVSQKDNQDVVNAVQDSGNKITSTLAETNAILNVIHSDLVKGNAEEEESDTEEQETSEEERVNEAEQTQSVKSMEVPIKDIDVSTERTADNTEGSGSSSSSSGGVDTESGAAGGSVAPMGNYLKLSNEGFSKALEPINGFLNNSVFGDIFNGLEGMLGSAGAQLGGMVFGIKTLFDGDKKEKLLSMIFLELQLIYTTLQSATSVAGHATGGFIRGAGTSTSDSIPAMLSNGEYVISADSVRKYGTNFMNAVNDGTFTQIPLGVPKFADGGFVGDTVSEETARGMSSFAGQIANNVSTTTNMSVALVGNQDEAMEHFMKSPRAQRIMLDFSRKTARFSSTLSGRF